jgi:hypothetical protein
MRRLRKFVDLPKREKQFFFQALLLIMAYRLRLKFLPLQVILQKVERRSQSLLASCPSEIEPKKIARLITAASALVPFSTCLSQALAGKILFAMNGYTTTLHIGVSNTSETGFEAHAWLRQNGEIVLGWLPDMERYRELPTLMDEAGG